MKRCIAVFVTTILMISLASCGESRGHDAYREIYKRYTNIESYYAEATVTVKNDRSENVYYVRQFYKAPDKYCMVTDGPEEVAGSGYVFRDGEVWLRSGFGKDETLGVISPNERSSTCIADFFEEYYKTEDASVTASGGALGNGATAMECQVSGKNPNRFRQRAVIDNKTFLPLRFETYDVNNNIVVEVVYNEFKLNCEIEDSLFK